MTSAQFALAEVTDLAGWLGEPIDQADDQARAGWALAAATSLVLEYTGQTETTWPMGGVPARVVHVVLACAARGYTNPEGWNYESVDDWRAGGRPVDEAGFFLTASEKTTLNNYAATPTVHGFGAVTTERPVHPRVCIDGVALAVLDGLHD